MDCRKGQLMTIKEVCGQFHITADTLRYYERVGAIPEIGRTAGGIRNYTEEDLKWIQNALCLRGAGVPVEMIIEYVKLFQQGDDTFEVQLLPALPDAWANGSISGICAKGNFEVSISWKEGQLEKAIIHSKYGIPCNVRYGDKTLKFKTVKGKKYEITLKGDKLAVL